MMVLEVATVVLFVMNLEGGSPAKVAEFPNMETCMEAVEAARGNTRSPFIPARLVCIPLPKKETI